MNVLERIYLAAHRIKTGRDLKRQKSLPAPVISVGNITTGGTGKTPAVIAISEEARSRGFEPCVLTRGYGGRLKGPVFVSSENYAEDVGDEPLLIAERLGDIPVVKCPDRYEGGIFAIENLDSRPGLFILDDGFQHRKLYREIDVVLVSALDPFGGGKLLPMGRLREPLSSLGRAGVIAITKSDSAGPGDAERLIEEIRKYNDNAHVFMSSHGAGMVRLGISHHDNIAGGGGREEPVEWLAGKRLFAFCGLAEPGSFIKTLSDAGAEVAGSMFFRDHYAFRQSDLKRLEEAASAAGADWIMTTEKDIMRLKALAPLPDNIAALRIDFRADDGFFERIFSIARGCDA